MLKGTCHCGAVEWTYEGRPESATSCNCTICRRYAGLWSYGWEGEGIDIAARPEDVSGYVWGDCGLAFHFCRRCGCVTHWRGLSVHPDGRRRIAVNLRLADPASVADLPIRKFDGFDTFAEVPNGGKCVSDYLT